MGKKDIDGSLMLVGILYLVLGIIFLAVTEELLKTFNYILVCICTFIGVIQLISFFINKKYKDDNNSDLLIGVIFIWVSLILYEYYSLPAVILPTLFSLYLFVMASDMIRKFILNKDKDKDKNKNHIKRGKYIILGLLAIIIGLLLIFNPGSNIIIYLKITGGYLVVVSMMYFSDFFKSIKNN